MTHILLFILVQQVIPLPQGRPVSSPPEKIAERGTAAAPDRAISNVTNPDLTVYLPEPARSKGKAILICPGGGYAHLAIDKEGHDVARRLQSAGYVGIVLKYRLPGSMKGTLESVEEAGRAAAPAIEDASQAMRMVRANAAKWGVKQGGAGIMGFSAGGHLAAMLGISRDPEIRPDFLVLVYPAIPKGLAEVPASTPPTFLVHADDDKLAAGDNSVRFYLAMKKANRPAELHVYSAGGHGFGMKKTGATSANWPDALESWLSALEPGK